MEIALEIKKSEAKTNLAANIMVSRRKEVSIRNHSAQQMSFSELWDSVLVEKSRAIHKDNGKVRSVYRYSIQE